MKILLIKTTSMGDVIHSLPALTDAADHITDLQCDWVVETSFSDIPKLHPAVNNIIPVAIRRWRKHLISAIMNGDIKRFLQQLRATNYDYIIDGQGLIKSACIARLARGIRCGFDRTSAREALATLGYKRTFTASWQIHAVERQRQLFAQALGYRIPQSIPNYGIPRTQFDKPCNETPYIIFLHGTTWATKHWPESYWLALAKLAAAKGFRIKLPWGNNIEYNRAKRLHAQCAHIDVLEKMSINTLSKVIAHAKAAVAVDTGLGHLAAALQVPTISIYGATDPQLTGTIGIKQIHVAAQFECAPCLQKKCSYRDKSAVKPACFSSVDPKRVWEQLIGFMS